MKKYSGKNKRVLQKVICNCCGREILVENGIEKEDYLAVKKAWGYFSDRDEELHELDLCESCYERWIQTFIVPVEKRKNRELL